MDRAHGAGAIGTTLSLEEFERLPEEDEYRVELVEGRIVREPRPGTRHGWLTARLSARLEPFVEKHGLGIVVAEGGFLLSVDPPTIRGPDVAVIATDLQPGGPTDAFWTVAPRLAIEIVSPSNTASGIRQKVLEYLGAGTLAVWVVDPATRTVSTYHSWDEVRLLTEADEIEGGDVLPGFRLSLSELFYLPRRSGELE